MPATKRPRLRLGDLAASLLPALLLGGVMLGTGAQATGAGSNTDEPPVLEMTITND